MSRAAIHGRGQPQVTALRPVSHREEHGLSFRRAVPLIVRVESLSGMRTYLKGYLPDVLRF